jgi:NOL1/NOP2/fmu family ribosome biogenesis protein
MTLHFLTKKETQEILDKLNEQFGISEIPGILVQIGQERIFLFQGSLNEEEIKKLERIVPIERVGIYFCKIQDDKIRLSIDGTQLLKDQIKKNIFELENEKQLEDWMHGREILLDDFEFDKKNLSKSAITVKPKSDSYFNNYSAKNLTKSILSPLISERNEPISGWAGGNNKEKPHGFVVMKYKEDFLGTGKASEHKITNFIPKNRRLRNKEN